MDLQTVPNLSVLFMVVSAILAILVPIGLIIILAVRRKVSVISALAGALVMIVSLIIGSVSQLFLQGVIANNALFIVLLSIRAGLVEETCLYLAFRFFLPRKDRVWDAVMYGLGHGGLEAIALVGMTMINNLALTAMINAGSFDALLQAAAGTAQYEALIQARDTMVQTASALFLTGGVERVIAMVLHVALSILVFYAVRMRRTWLYPLAILLHAAVNSILLFSLLDIGVWPMEGILAIATVLVCVLVWLLVRNRRGGENADLIQEQS